MREQFFFERVVFSAEVFRREHVAFKKWWRVVVREQLQFERCRMTES